MSIGTGTQVSLPRSRTVLLGVITVVIWTVCNTIAGFALAAVHKVQTVNAPSASDRFFPVVVATFVALTYILVVRRSPSARRWLWCGLVVFLMVIVAGSSLQRSQSGVHVYTFGGALGSLFVGLAIAGPLVWFYAKPAKVRNRS